MKQFKILTLGIVFPFILINCSPMYAQKGSGNQNLFNIDNSSVFAVIEADPATSVEVFERTLGVILQKNCASCHGDTQQPLFALINSQEGHDNLLSSSLVNFSQIEDSLIVEKIFNGHQDFPKDLSNDISISILAWAEELLMESRK